MFCFYKHQIKNMKFDSLLRSSHDLKKNGYKMVRKLHKLEDRKGACKAYSAVYQDTYFFLLCYRSLVKIIEEEYPNELKFSNKCEAFISYLDSIAERKGLISKSYLAGFLRSYTQFFNEMIEKKVNFRINQELITLWNQKCLMAYIATWGKNGRF